MQCVDRRGGTVLGSVFFQAEDGIRDVERSRGLGDVYKRQHPKNSDNHFIFAWYVGTSH